MFDFTQFVQDSWNAMATAILAIVTWLHIGQNKKIQSLDVRKVDKNIYTLEKATPIPLEKKIDKIETYLKLLLDKEGINYHE